MCQNAYNPLTERLLLTEPEETDSLTIQGLPDTQIIWRTVTVGEITRSGDYTFLTDRWYPAPCGFKIESDRPRVWRPMGPDARRWFVGASHWEYRFRDGDPERPFSSLEEALARIEQPAVGLLYDLRNLQVLRAFDPPAAQPLSDSPPAVDNASVPQSSRDGEQAVQSRLDDPERERSAYHHCSAQGIQVKAINQPPT